jgi:hypothetical protein
MNSKVKNEIPSGRTRWRSVGSHVVPSSQFDAAATDDSPKSQYLKSASTPRSKAMNAPSSTRLRAAVRPRMRPKV